MYSVYQIQETPDELLQITSAETPYTIHTNLDKGTKQEANPELLGHLEKEAFWLFCSEQFSPNGLVWQILTSGTLGKLNDFSRVSPNNIHIQLHVSSIVAILLRGENNIASTGTTRNGLNTHIKYLISALYLLHLYKTFVDPIPQTLQEAYFAQSNWMSEYCPPNLSADMWELVEFHARCSHAEKTQIPLQEQFGWPSVREIDATFVREDTDMRDVGKSYREDNESRSKIMREWLDLFFRDLLRTDTQSNSCLSEDHSLWLDGCNWLFSDTKTQFLLSQTPHTGSPYDTRKLRGVDYRQFQGLWTLIGEKK